MASSIIQTINETFAEHSKTDWVKKTENDLKGKPLEDLQLLIGNQIKIDPLYTNEDTFQDKAYLKNYDPNWQIGAKYIVEDYKKSNQVILADLQHGLNAPVIAFKNLPSDSDLNQLFNGIQTKYITTYIKDSHAELATIFNHWKKENNIEGPIFFKSTNQGYLNGKLFYKGTEHLLEELESIKNQLTSTSYDDAPLIEILVNNHFLINVAKIRVVKAMTYLTYKKLPKVSVSFADDAYGEDQYDNLINATSMAMSAVMGGANQVLITPTEQTTKGERLARNIQLILQNESHLNQYADPFAGSYYIENICDQLLEKLGF